MQDINKPKASRPAPAQADAPDAESASSGGGGLGGLLIALGPFGLLGVMAVAGAAVAVPVAAGSVSASLSGLLSILLAVLGLLLGGLVLHRSRQMHRTVSEAEDRLARAEQRSAAALEESRELRALLLDAVNSIDEGFVLFDADGRLVVCNDRYRSIYAGLADVLVPGVTFEEILFAAAQRSGVAEDMRSQQALRTWIAARLNRHLEAAGPVEAQLSDGCWYRIGERPTSGGGIVKVLTDITDLRQQQAALAAKSDVLETTFQAMAQGVCVFDADLQLASWNHQFGPLAGYADDLLRVGTPLTAFLSADAQRGVSALPASPMPREAAAAPPREIRLPGGAILEVARSALPHGGFVATFTDITARRQAEVALQHSQKMDAVGQLAGGIAHEFNNMLTSIGGFAHLARRNPADGARVGMCLDQIIKASDRAASLTAQLLDFSRRSDTDHRMPIHLKSLARDLQEFLRPLLGERVAVRVSVGDPALVVQADQAKLMQAIVNLCINARDATLAKDTGGGTVDIAIDRVALADSPLAEDAALHGRDLARIRVTDTGTGIPPDILPRIFEPFFTTKEQGKGTGLGLPMVYSMAEQQGGTVTVETEEGQGATFAVYLPATTPPAAMDDTLEAAALPAAAHRLVLVAEDEDAVRDLICLTLQEAGFSVLAAADGAEAAAAFEQHGDDIAALITDVVMPRLDGPALARRLRGHNPDLKIVLVSGYDANDAAAAMAEAPGCTFLRKPLVPDALVAALTVLLTEDEDEDDEDFVP